MDILPYIAKPNMFGAVVSRRATGRDLRLRCRPHLRSLQGRRGTSEHKIERHKMQALDRYIWTRQEDMTAKC